MAYLLKNTKKLVVLCCCFAVHGYEMFSDLKRLYTAIVLVMKPFVWRRLLAVVVLLKLSKCAWRLSASEEVEQDIDSHFFQPHAQGRFLACRFG